MLDDVLAELRRLRDLMPPPDQRLASIHMANPDALVTDLGIDYRFGSPPLSAVAGGTPVHRNLALHHNVIRFVYEDGHHEDRTIRT